MKIFSSRILVFFVLNIILQFPWRHVLENCFMSLLSYCLFYAFRNFFCLFCVFTFFLMYFFVMGFCDRCGIWGILHDLILILLSNINHLYCHFMAQNQCVMTPGKWESIFCTFCDLF